MKIPRVEPELLSLLHSDRLQSFTVLDLRDAYLQLASKKTMGKTKARQFVYRNILRLEQKGFIELITNVQGGKPRYQSTHKFKSSYQAVPANKAVAPERAAGEVGIISSLREKANHYKNEILSTIGETEEYDALCNELPHLKSEIQLLYNEARERCSKTLGRVRALETVISQSRGA